MVLMSIITMRMVMIDMEQKHEEKARRRRRRGGAC